MNRSPVMTAGAGTAGVVLMLLAALYLSAPAHSLPAFIPGHVSVNDADAGNDHVKPGVAALAVGLAALAYARMNSGPAAKARRDEARGGR